MSLENLLNNGSPEANTNSQSQSPQPIAANTAPEQPSSPQPTVQRKEEERQPSFAKQFSALSRREREIRQREQAIAEKEKSLQSGSDKYSEYTRKLKLDPVKALEEAGVSMDYITNAILSGGVPAEVKISTEVEDLKAQLAAMQAKLEGKNEPEIEASPEEQAVAEFIQGLENHVEANAEKYKLIKKHDALQVVFDLIDVAYEQSAQEAIKQGKTPTVMSYEEACDLVEAHFRDEARKLAEELGFVARNEPVDQGSNQVKQPGSSSSPTLSNQHSATRPTSQEGSRLLTREESLARAAGLLKHV
jgi:hypothetical protein